MKTFKAACFILTLTSCVVFIPELIENSAPIAYGIFVIIISPLMMQVIAQAFEGRWLWPPREQFNAFLYGDTFALPILAVCMASTFQQWDGGKIVYEWYGWILFILGLSIGIAAVIRERESLAYSKSSFNSPTKLWHDLYVVPTLIFLILFPLPAMFYMPFGLSHLVGGVAFVVFLVFLAEPGASKKRRNAHVAYDWGEHKPISARN